MKSTVFQQLTMMTNNTKSKKTLFIDMDNVLVNFQSGIDQLDGQTKQTYKGRLDDVPGIFAMMKPMPGAIEAVRKLQERFELYILSTAPWNNPTAWGDKLEWVKRYFGGEEGDVFYKRLIFSHHKDLCLNHGDYLIDDRDDKNGTEKYKEAGKLIHFGTCEFPNWDAVLEYLMRE